MKRHFSAHWLTVTAAILLAIPSLAQEQAHTANLPSIPQLWAEGGLTGRGPETVEWSPDDSRISYVLRSDSGEHGELWYLDVKGDKPAVLVAAGKLATLVPPMNTGGKQTKDDRERDFRARYSVAGYHWAPDSKHLLFDSNGELWYYTLENGTAVQLTSSAEANGDPKFSPDGKRIAYTRKHNLYVRGIAGDSSETALTTTTDEDGKNIRNGEVDWVYEEELSVRSNYFWSPDGKHIVYLQMNETEVPQYPITDFMPDHPTVDEQKYPYSGDPNPAVRVGVVDSNGGKTHWISISGLVGKQDKNDYYIPRFGWVNKNVIYVQALNRDQNQLDLYFVDVATGKSRLVLSEKDDAWINMNDDFRIFKSGDRFLWSSWRDGHTHLYLYSFDKNNPLAADAKLENQITHGDFEVTGVEALNETAGIIFVQTNANDDRQRNIYSVKLDGTDFKRISHEDGTHQAKFSDDTRYYVDTYSALMTPPRMSMCSVSGTCSPFWESRSVSSYSVIKPEFVDFHADDGTVLHALLLLPPGASPEQKAPVLMNPYGGPTAQMVADRWGGSNFFFDQILANDGIAVLRIDNRGMGFRGKKFATVLRHNFGTVELHDQLTALDQALQRYPQLDGSRLGWWGWSYGGFMTSYAMTHSDRFKSGVAVAPVTDWHDYDSIYTERYMGLPKDNPQGYKTSSVQLAASHLSGHLLVVHGTSDDNVHMQNTIQLAQHFINSGHQFELLFYPRKTHAIAGQAARTNLYERIRGEFDFELLGWTPQKIAESNPPFPPPHAEAQGGSQ
ncbi:MAG TPA: S9 family peptidase [Terriglobales bacterium]|nr:S9 family peptidase [Terriglobales bacterium]